VQTLSDPGIWSPGATGIGIGSQEARVPGQKVQGQGAMNRGDKYRVGSSGISETGHLSEILCWLRDRYT